MPLTENRVGHVMVFIQVRSQKLGSDSECRSSFIIKYILRCIAAFMVFGKCGFYLLEFLFDFVLRGKI